MCCEFKQRNYSNTSCPRVSKGQVTNRVGSNGHRNCKSLESWWLERHMCWTTTSTNNEPQVDLVVIWLGSLRPTTTRRRELDLTWFCLSPGALSFSAPHHRHFSFRPGECTVRNEVRIRLCLPGLASLNNTYHRSCQLARGASILPIIFASW